MILYVYYGRVANSETNKPQLARASVVNERQWLNEAYQFTAHPGFNLARQPTPWIRRVGDCVYHVIPFLGIFLQIAIDYSTKKV